MKLKFTILVFLLLQIFSLKTNAQLPCPLNGGPSGTIPISTDPLRRNLTDFLNDPYMPPSYKDQIYKYGSGSPIDPATGLYIYSDYHQNKFTWYKPSQFDVGIDWYQNNLSGKISNFFYVLGKDYSSHIAKGKLSDFWPQDGWELIKRDFGYLANGTKFYNASGPYFILYNKYSSVLRVVAAIPGLGAQQAINVTLKFVAPDKSNPNLANLNVSGLFGNNTNVAQPMDQSTVIKKIVSPAIFPGSDANFFYADFQLSYDPCACLFESALQVSFATFNTLDVKLDGKLFGFGEPISNMAPEGTVIIDSGKDYLASVFRDDADNVHSGLIRYKSVDDMIEEYMGGHQSDMQAVEEGVKIVGEFIKVILSFARVSNVSPTTLQKGLEKTSAITDFFSSMVGGGGEALPSVIHAEMSMKGTISDKRAIGAEDIIFSSPGSKGSNLKPEYNKGTSYFNPEYPLYNEVLGTFALLNTPKINHYTEYSQTCAKTCWTDYHSRRDEYQITDMINYAINPAMVPDLSKDTIKASLVFEINPLALGGYKLYPHNLSKDYELTDKYGKVTKQVFSTPYVDLKCINQQIAAFDLISGGNDSRIANYISNIYIKLTVNISSYNVGRLNKPNGTIAIYKYPVNPVNTNSSISNFPFGIHPDSLVLPATDYPRFYLNPAATRGGAWLDYGPIKNLYSWGNIKFTGNQTVNVQTGSAPFYTPFKSFESINFYTWGTITQNPGVTLNPLIHLYSNKPNCNNATGPTTNISSFCNSLYKANTTPSPGRISPDSLGILFQNYINISPNPVKENAQINYAISQPSMVYIALTDIMGKQTKVLVNKHQDKGEYVLDLSTSELESGMYICTMHTNDYNSTVKLIVVK